MSQKFEIAAYFPTDGDTLVADIFFDNLQVAIVRRQENGKFMVDFSKRVDGAPQVFDADDLVEAIREALKKLTGPDKIAELLEKKLREGKKRSR